MVVCGRLTIPSFSWALTSLPGAEFSCSRARVQRRRLCVVCFVQCVWWPRVREVAPLDDSTAPRPCLVEGRQTTLCVCEVTLPKSWPGKIVYLRDLNRKWAAWPSYVTCHDRMLYYRLLFISPLSFMISVKIPDSAFPHGLLGYTFTFTGYFIIRQVYCITLTLQHYLLYAQRSLMMLRSTVALLTLVLVGLPQGRFNTLRPRQYCCHLTDDIFKCIFMNETVWILIRISLMFLPKFEQMILCFTDALRHPASMT